MKYFTRSIALVSITLWFGWLVHEVLKGMIFDTSSPEAVSTRSKLLHEFPGVDCTGHQDSTSGVQEAVRQAGGGTVRIRANCIPIVDSIELTPSITFLGEGPTSGIKHRANATSHMLIQNNTGPTNAAFANMTLDGNYQNNGANGRQKFGTLKFYGGGLSSTEPATIVIENVTFVNGGMFDVSLHNATSPYVPYFWRLQESNTRHLGGADGYAAGSFSEAVDANLTNIVIDPGRLPVTPTAWGRAGYIFFLSNAANSNYSSVTANNFQCYNTGTTGGQGSPNGELGCLDGYQGIGKFSVSNSISQNAVGRGFTWKADASNVLLSNVTCSGLHGNTENKHAAAPGACFGQNGGAHNVHRVGANYIMTGLICSISKGSCIYYNGYNNDKNSPGVSANVIIDNFIVDGCGNQHAGLQILNPTNVVVRNGTILNCGRPLVVNADSGTGPTQISGLLIRGSGKPNFNNSAKRKSLWYSLNVQDAPWDTTELKIGVEANRIFAWNPVIVVDNDQSDQTVRIIENVPDGAEVTVLASSNRHTLSVEAGGNVRLRHTPFVSRSPPRILRLVSINGELVETHRSGD